MMGQDLAALRARAERLAALLGPAAQVVATNGFAGGGTLPDAGNPSMGVALYVDKLGVDRPGVDRPGVNRPGVDRPGVDRPGMDGPGADGPERVRAALREGRPPVVARVADDRVLLDMLTVQDCEVPEVAAAVQQVLAA